jgi:hypothetical protein
MICDKLISFEESLPISPTALSASNRCANAQSPGFSWGWTAYREGKGCALGHPLRLRIKLVRVGGGFL